MIIKNFEINKSILENYNFYLFYGVNEGSKNEKIDELLKDFNKDNIFNYEENQILNDENSFLESVLNKSLFEERKIIIIKRATNKILDIMSNAPERKDTWSQYKKRYLTKDRINNGILYYKNNISLLKKIESVYGVPPEILVAFLGVETNYGSYTGKIKVIDSLGTLALKHPSRNKFFREQLINLIVLSFRNNLDYLQLKGSYAGAMGLPQFMPDNYRKLAIDFDQDGKIDLWSSKLDIYASISNFLNKKGWKKGEKIYLSIKVEKKYIQEIFKNGDVKTVPISNKKLKIYSGYKNSDQQQKYLILLNKKEAQYKMGFKNFKVIMRYNPSTFYAMVVALLSEEIKKGI